MLFGYKNEFCKCKIRAVAMVKNELNVHFISQAAGLFVLDIYCREFQVIEMEIKNQQ